MIMGNLELEPEIIISRLRGEDPRAAVETLNHVFAVVKNREHDVVRRGLSQWDGPTTVVVIVPSSEVFDGDYRTVEMAQVLARNGRRLGISLRLLDAAPPLPLPDPQGRPIYPLSVCGSAILRAFASATDVATVTVHQLTPLEMTELTESIYAT